MGPVRPAVSSAVCKSSGESTRVTCVGLWALLDPARSRRGGAGRGIWIPFISFSALIAVAKTSKTMLFPFAWLSWNT